MQPQATKSHTIKGDRPFWKDEQEQLYIESKWCKKCTSVTMKKAADLIIKMKVLRSNNKIGT